LYLVLLLTASTVGGLLIARRSAVYVALCTLSVFGLAKAWGDVYLVRIQPGTHPRLISLVAVNLVLALVCASATAVGVRVRRTLS
jgi:hypothetical protein